MCLAVLAASKFNGNHSYWLDYHHVGFQSLAEVQAWESVLVAGSAKHLLYARIDAQRFVSVQNAKGKKPFFSWLLFNPELQTRDNANEQQMTKIVSINTEGESRRPVCLSQQAIAIEIRRVAADIVGVQVPGVVEPSVNVLRVFKMHDAFWYHAIDISC